MCNKLLGLESGKGKCFAHQLNKCTGVCVGHEKHELHHLRLRQALIEHKIKTWPFEGRIGIKELNTDTNNTEVHIFEHWCHLETVNNEIDLAEASTTKYEKKFDLDFYKLIQKSITTTQKVLLL